jgi:hypothetical protein
VIASLLGVTKTRIQLEWKLWRTQKSRRRIAHEYAVSAFLLSENCHLAFRRLASAFSHENNVLLLNIPPHVNS